VVKGRLVQGTRTRFLPGGNPRRVSRLASQEIKVHGTSLLVERKNPGKLGGEDAKVSS
jgi:hypothetical protein